MKEISNDTNTKNGNKKLCNVACHDTFKVVKLRHVVTLTIIRLKMYHHILNYALKIIPSNLLKNVDRC